MADDPSRPRKPRLSDAALHTAKMVGRAGRSLLTTGKRPVWRPAEVPGGRLEVVGGHPLLKLRGSRYKMGRAHGTLLREEARRLKESYLETFYGGPGKRSLFLAKAKVLEQHLPWGFREELHGLATGTGLSRDDVLLIHTFLDIHKLFLCSTITVPRPAAEGGPIVGRNLDFPGMGIAHHYGMITVTHGQGRHAAASVGWPSFIGTLSGMNETGLVVAMMLVYGVEDTTEGMPFAALFREALETQETVDGVYDLINSTPRTCSNNLLVVEPSGKAAVLEIRPSKVVRRSAHKGCLLSTNHFLEAGRGSALHDPVRLPSLFRYFQLNRFAKKKQDRLDIPDVKKSLRMVASRWLNLQSMVFEPRKRRMEVAMGGRPASKGPWTELTAEQLFD